MASYRMDSSEDEALFRSYPYALYFVQSPSNFSHANSTNNNNNNNNDELSFTYHHSPLPSENFLINTNPNCSSSHGSNDSFLHEKGKKVNDQIIHDRIGVLKVSYGENHGGLLMKNNVVDGDDDNDYDDEFLYGDEKNKGWQKYFSLSYSDTWWWIWIQLIWRFLLSLMIAFLVFYVATKPPTPKVFVKMAGIGEFRLGEGVDGSGVSTKILSCNTTLDLMIDNKSKIFGLHIHPPIINMFFTHFPFASSQGSEMYAGSDNLTVFKLNIGTRNKAMYGAGRTMQDLLESGKGLPLIIKLSFKSNFNVIWGFFKPKFHYNAQCLLLLSNTYDKKHRTHKYNSTCIVM